MKLLEYIVSKSIKLGSYKNFIAMSRERIENKLNNNLNIRFMFYFFALFIYCNIISLLF